MILPIGHQESSVRRLPWVTFSIILICTVSWILTDCASAPTAVHPRSVYLPEAADYWRDHAYLDAHPAVLEEVARNADDPDELLAHLHESALDEEPDRETRSREQERLDELTEMALGQRPPELSSDSPFARFGLTPRSPHLHAFLTHVFMHGGWLHLLSNMFLLFLAGPAVEDRWGRPLFAAFFLLAGVFAGASHAVMTRAPELPLVGASGAIAGVMGAFFVRFWNTKIRFFYFIFLGFLLRTGTFHAPAWLMLPLWFGNEVFHIWLTESFEVVSGVAYWAHVGGFAFGATAAGLVKALRLEERFIHPAIESKVTVAEANPVIEEAMQAREEGDLGAAYTLLEREVREHPDDPDVAVTFWDVAVSSERAAQAAPLLGRVIRSAVGRGEIEHASELWMELTNLVPDALLDAGTLLKLSSHLHERGMFTKSVEALRHAVAPGNALTPGLALRVVEAARPLDPPTALRAARRALESPDVHEAKRARVEALVAELEAAGVSEELDALGGGAMHGGPGGERGIALDEGWEQEWQAGLAHDPRAGPAHDPRALPPEQLGAALAAPLAAAARPAGSPESDDSAAERDRARARLDLDATPADRELSAEPLEGQALDFECSTPPLALDDATPPPLPAGGARPPPLPESAPAPAPPPLPDLGTTGLEAGGARDAGLSDEEIHVLEELGSAPRFAALKVVDARPTRFAENALYLEIGSRKAKVDYAQIDAVSVAAVRGLSAKPVVVIDLALNWCQLEELALRVIRLRSDRFDPRRLADEADSTIEALRVFLEQLLGRGEAASPLPDRDAARGRPFRVFDTLAAYEREVLQVEPC